MRLIDKDALMQSLGITDMDCDKCAWYDREWSNCERGGEFEDACCAIENAPTIEPERKKGKWINAYPDIEPNPMLMYGICSVCGFEQSISDKLKYCPNCGARMVQEGEDNAMD